MTRRTSSPPANGIRCRHLFARELPSRPGGLAVGILAIALSASAWVGVRLALAAHDQESEARLAALDEETSAQMAALRNEARLFSRHLGFDTTVLPPEQDPQEYLQEHRSRHFFSMEQAQALADRKPATINHILPVLRGRADWPSSQHTNRVSAIVVGIVGQIFIAQPEWQSPMQEDIPPGDVVLGADLAARMGAVPDGTITWGTQTFRVRRVQPPRGNADDAMAMMHLSDAQTLLNLPGRISAIMALSCNCPVNPGNPFISIRLELARLLPGAQILGNTIHAEARSQARRAVAKTSREQEETMRRTRAELRANLLSFGRLLTLFASAAALVTVAALSALNARERRGEIALLKALGIGPGRILSLLAGRAALMGLGGALVGSLGAMLVGRLGFGLNTSDPLPLSRILLLLLAAPVAAIGAALIPALAVTGRDPARELARE